jgi:hypothetical protein
MENDAEGASLGRGRKKENRALGKKDGIVTLTASTLLFLDSPLTETPHCVSQAFREGLPLGKKEVIFLNEAVSPNNHNFTH